MPSLSSLYIQPLSLSPPFTASIRSITAFKIKSENCDSRFHTSIQFNSSSIQHLIMGFSKKIQADGDSKDGKRWVIAGITLRAPLKPITAKLSNGDEEDDNLESGSTTPTSNGLSVAECPPPPRKRRPVSKCQKNGNGNKNREFYTSPDIDSFFQVALNTGRAN